MSGTGYKLSKLLKAQELARLGKVEAPLNFLLATWKDLVKYCNGCGASESWFRPPETMYGTDISAACIIHDWMYSFGEDITDKEVADRTFLNNLQRLVQLDSDKWYKPTTLQMTRTVFYYSMVVWFGGPAFWKGKDRV
jgi:hypothetical protein